MTRDIETRDPSAGERLYSDPDLVQFYDIENGWAADTDYCFRRAQNARSVLDLGCGTGLLAAALAEGRTGEGPEGKPGGRTVTGVDPAAAMLAVARSRPGGDRVAWVEADARGLRLDRRFDLVLLTGHAFQVFLTPEDQLAVLRTIAHHLAPDGIFLFDSRNPRFESWRRWTPEQSERTIEHPELGPVKAWNDVAHDAATGIVTYETHYQILRDGHRLSAASKIRFTPQEELAALIDEADLSVDEWLGSWQGNPYTPDAREIIPIGRLR